MHTVHRPRGLDVCVASEAQSDHFLLVKYVVYRDRRHGLIWSFARLWCVCSCTRLDRSSRVRRS